MYTLDVLGRPEKFESIVPGDTSTGISVGNLTSATNQQACAALVTVEAQSINYSLHGTAPTAAAGTNVGHQLKAEETLILRGIDEVKNFRCIDRVSGSASTVKVTIYF